MLVEKLKKTIVVKILRKELKGKTTTWLSNIQPSRDGSPDKKFSKQGPFHLLWSSSCHHRPQPHRHHHHHHHPYEDYQLVEKFFKQGPFHSEVVIGEVKTPSISRTSQFWFRKNDLQLVLPLSEHEIVASGLLHNWLMTFSENCNHLPILLWVPSSQGLNQILNDSFWLWGKSFNAVGIIIQGWLLIEMCWKRSTFRRVRENWGIW